MSTAVPVVDATAIVVPSPDSSQVSIMVVLPTTSMTSVQLPDTTSLTQEFRLICGLDTLESHMTLSCKVYQHDTSSINLISRLHCFCVFENKFYRNILIWLFLCVSRKPALKLLTHLIKQVITPSVHEEVSVGYQRWETIGCVGGITSLALLNHTHQFQHTSCHDPANLQMTLSHSGNWRCHILFYLLVNRIYQLSLHIINITVMNHI